MASFQLNVFGGVNFADEPTSLLARSHEWQGDQYVHRMGSFGPIPVEAAGGQNFDLDRQRLIKRKGSTILDSFTMLDSDVIVVSKRVRLASTGVYASFKISKKTIYTNQSGVWAQINDSASAAYTHNDQTVTSASITEGDGGVFFGLGGNNKIQRYLTGADLDPEMDNGNAYTDAGGTGQTITGVWGVGYENTALFDGRLVFNDTSSTVQYTGVNQPWDLGSGGGNFPAQGAVTAVIGHVPKFGSTFSAILYIGTSQGWEFTSDLASANTIDGSPPPLSQFMVLNTPNWIMYMTTSFELWAINGPTVINVGRRLKTGDNSTSLLDQINDTQADIIGRSYYDESQKQAVWTFPTGSGATNDSAVVLDTQLGEPMLGEPMPSFETHVRCLQWTGMDYDSIYASENRMIGAKDYSGNLNTAVYASKSVDISAEDTGPQGIAFSSDGTKMYSVGGTNKNIFQYTITAWDVSTAVYASKFKNVNTEDVSPQGVAFSSDGTKMYVVGATNKTIFQYTLTAWDVSTAVYASKFKNVSAEDISPRSVAFSADGTKMYVLGASSTTVYQYTLTAWDVSTAVYASKSVSVSPADSNPEGVSFSVDGTKMYIVDQTTTAVYQFILSEAWDVGTASYTSKTIDVSSEDANPFGLAFNPDGTDMYVLGGGTAIVFQYALDNTATFTLKNGTNDFDDTAIDSNWFSPIHDAGMPSNQKGYLVAHLRSLFSGNWDLSVDYLLNRETTSAGQWVFAQGGTAALYGTAVYGTGTYGSIGIAKGANDTDLVADTLQIKISNANAGENYTVTNMQQDFEMLAEER